MMELLPSCLIFERSFIINSPSFVIPLSKRNYRQFFSPTKPYDCLSYAKRNKPVKENEENYERKHKSKEAFNDYDKFIFSRAASQSWFKVKKAKLQKFTLLKNFFIESFSSSKASKLFPLIYNSTHCEHFRGSTDKGNLTSKCKVNRLNRERESHVN